MSLPETAGVVEPRRLLKGQRLEAFNSTATTVPLDTEPVFPTLGYYKVEPHDMEAVNKNCYTAGWRLYFQRS